jgi:hypothetical protein
MSIFKPAVRPSGERKVLSLWGKVKTVAPVRSPSAVDFERVWAAEGHFVQALRLERKRAERSQQPFLLMLLEGTEAFGGNGGGSTLFAVTAALGGAIRETDLCGWYRQNRTLGVIFTEVNPAEVASTIAALSAKVKVALSRCLKAEEVERIEVSLHLFPEGPQRNGQQSGEDSVLYPDVRKRVEGASWPC